jgi:SpoVK/Ycf46/Vps4 family AAA+-type ATPase
LRKYIGETERNLAELLARAEHAEVVLLFDEADALFGKRTDVRHSTDRFANAQTNYLLSRIESYEGIVLLTSNTRSRFDEAFARRLDVVLELPAPGPEERRALWHAHLGAGHALDARAMNQLALSVDLVGGHVKNVVLAASVLASSERRPIGWDDLLRCLELEYRKLGRPLPAALSSADGARAARPAAPAHATEAE